METLINKIYLNFVIKILGLLLFYLFQLSSTLSCNRTNEKSY